MQRAIWYDKNLYIIFSITLIAVMGVASLTPAFPEISRALLLTESEVGMLISAFTLPGIFLAPFTGILGDRWGRKKVLVPSLFIFAGGGFACYFTHDYNLLILFRFVQGVGAASLGSLNVTLIGDFFKGKMRAEAMGYNASFLSLSTAMFPLIGGALAGIAWYFPFLLPLLAVPVGFYVIFYLQEPDYEKAPGFRQYLKDVSRSIFKKEVIAVFLLSIITFVILYGAFLTYLPFLLDEKFKLTAPEIGLVFSASSITTAIFASLVGRLTHRFGSPNLLKTAFLLYFFVMVLLPNTASVLFFLFPVILFGTAQALNIPSLQTLLANLSPDGQRAAFMSLNGMVLRLGQTIGPLVVGLGYSMWGLHGAYYLTSAIALAGFIIIILMLGPKASAKH